MVVASASSNAIAPWPERCTAISFERVAMTLRPSARLSPPETIAAATSPMEWPITASGSTPRERHSAVSANCTPTRTGWIRSIPTTASPEVSVSRSEKPTCATKSGSISSIAAAKAGSSARRRRPMPAHCAPCPE
ncbi:Uncharacterised protein [Mycobacteroides abscessus subsp. abscessus]|nr:Uncharacterised protein [Mycobacteroides abscessus subsp. abscessus]